MMADYNETTRPDLIPAAIDMELDYLEQHPMTPNEINEYHRDPQNSRRMQALGDIIIAFTAPKSPKPSDFTYVPSVEAVKAFVDKIQLATETAKGDQ